MPKKKKTEAPSSEKRRIRPALTPEARENQMISLAVDLAEQQLLDGTASAQVITHYLKLGTMKEKLEREKLQKENELLMAKTKALESTERIEQLYAEAMEAFKSHGSIGDYEEMDEEYED
jgi:hypothetical protein